MRLQMMMALHCEPAITAEDLDAIEGRLDHAERELRTDILASVPALMATLRDQHTLIEQLRHHVTPQQ